MTRSVHYTSCPYNCWPVNCGLRVAVEDGEIVEIDGNPHHDVSRGRLCVKGQCCGEIVTSKERITTPLVRVHNNRANDFTLDTWENVLDRIAGRMKHNIDTGRREANAIYHSHGNIVQRVNWKVLTPRFANLVGMTHWDGNFPCWYDVGLAQHLTGYWGLHDPVSMGAHAAGVVNWAQDPCASQANLVPYLREVKERGGTMVTIDPRVTQTAALSNLHLRPRLGSDVWLAGAVAHILIAEGVADETFARDHGHGYERYREMVLSHSPADAARKCDLTLSEVEELARVFAETKPLTVNLSRGALGKHRGGVQMVRGILNLVPLSGNVGVRGGGVVWGENVDWNLDLCLAKRRPDAPYPVNNYGAIDDALEQGLIDCLLVVGGNPLSQWPNLPRLRKQLEQVGLVVVFDLFGSQTVTEAADIVLPATSWLEELGLRTTGSRVYLSEKVLSPPGECREASEWMDALCSRLGIDDYFPWADKEQCLDACLDSPACRGATVSSLRAKPEGFPAHISPVPYSDGAFDSPTGKFEFYSTRAAELGLPPLPTHEEPLEAPWTEPALAESHPLQLISARRNTHFHSFHRNHQAVPTLRALEPVPLLQMHPGDATSRGIEDGARAVMFNERGRASVTVELTTEVAPGQVSLDDAWSELNEVTPSFAPCPIEVTATTGLGGQPAYQNCLVEIKWEEP